jgi:hypothetical protein
MRLNRSFLNRNHNPNHNLSALEIKSKKRERGAVAPAGMNSSLTEFQLIGRVSPQFD